MKKVALMQSAARMSSTRLVYGGSGPSSKVNTTSWSASGSDSEYCKLPICACCVGSTTMVRLTPNVSGLPGHSPALAAPTAASHPNTHDHFAVLRILRPLDFFAQSCSSELSTAKRRRGDAISE